MPGPLETIYDAPQDVVDMLLDDELTVNSLQRAFTGKLSPKESEGVTDRIKSAFGNTRLGNTVVDILSNPWVWAGMAFSGSFRNAFGEKVKTRQSLFGPPPGAGAFERENPILLQTLHLATVDQAFEGTPLPAAIRQLAHTKETLEVGHAKIVAGAYKKMAAELGVSDLTEQAISRLPEDKRKKAQAFEHYLAVMMGGFDEARPQYVNRANIAYEARRFDPQTQTYTTRTFKDRAEALSFYDAMKGAQRPGTPMEWEMGSRVTGFSKDVALDDLKQPIMRPQLHTKEFMDYVRAKYPILNEVYEARKAANESLLHQLVGGPDGLDAVKIQKLYRSQQGGSASWLEDPTGFLRESGASEGEAGIEHLVGPYMRKLVATGQVSRAEYESLLKQSFDIQEHYYPLNRTSRRTLSNKGTRDNFDAVKGHDWDTSGRTIGKTRKEVVFDLDDLLTAQDATADDYTEFLSTKPASAHSAYVASQTEALNASHKMLREAEDRGKAVSQYRLGFSANFRSYDRDMMNSIALRQTTPGQAVLDAQREFLTKADQPIRTSPPIRNGVSEGAYFNVPFDQVPAHQLPGTGTHWTHSFSLADVIEQAQVNIADKTGLTQHQLRTVVMPSVLGSQTAKRSLENYLWGKTRQTLDWLGNSRVAGLLEKQGGAAAEFVKGVRRQATLEYPPGGENGISYRLAQGLYASHLAFNMPTIIGNLTQPFVVAGNAVGYDKVLRAYVPAMAEMLEYAKERATLGANITDEAKRALIQKHFQFAGNLTKGRNVLGIGPSEMEAIDQAFGHFQGKTAWDKFYHFGMLGFEKSEWLNRNVAAHATALAMEAQGVARTEPYALQQIEAMVHRTQFSDAATNTPEFLESIKNPLLKQFVGFQVRAATSLLRDIPMALQGDGTFKASLFRQAMRGMGSSAILYEIGKNMFGADMSRSMYAGTAGGIVGESKFEEDSAWPIPVPPLLDIPVNVIRSWTNDDKDLWARTIPRLVPGGVAASRLLNSVAPELGTFQSIGLQRTFADWEQMTPDGLVPVRKVDSGQVMYYKSPIEIAMRGAGVDVGRWGEQGSLDHYVLGMKRQMDESRQQALMALKRNNVAEYQRIQRDFQRANGIPLILSQAQIAGTMGTDPVTRTESILKRMNPEVRAQYEQLYANAGVYGGLGLSANAPTNAVSTGTANNWRESQ